MFMSTRYKKKDPEWRKKTLFTFGDSLAKLLECLSIEYSVSKLISPKWKNFRSQKLKFEAKTRINNAIWRCWHIQCKEKQRARFFKFDMPFSDQTVHSTPQAIILEGRLWKERLEIVSREYKKWRKFYNVKILKGGGTTEEKDSLKQLSNENSEDDFTSDEEEFNDGKRHRASLAKAELKTAVPGQKIFQSANFGLDAFVADLPDTLFSSIPPVDGVGGGTLGLTSSDLSDMIQPNLDQLNPCFDDLLQHFDFLTSDWTNLQNNSRPLATVEESTLGEPLQSMINIEDSGSQLSQNLLMTDQMFALASTDRYLCPPEVLCTPDRRMQIDKSEEEALPPMLTDEKADQGLQFAMSSRKETGVKRAITESISDNTTESSLPKKMAVQEIGKTSEFLAQNILQGQNLHEPINAQSSISQMSFFEPKNSCSSTTANLEALLSNAMGTSSADMVPPEKAVESLSLKSSSSIKETNLDSSIHFALHANESSSQVVQRKMIVNQTSTTKVVEYSELPPQLQAPNLTAHLQAVMSTRTKNPGLPRNKSDTQLSSLEEKFAFPSSVKNTSMRKDSPASLSSRGKRGNAKLPRNMSDSNLVQMANDSRRVFARRRLSSISVDSKPLILPKNFSDSNLCALGRGMPKRPQPILPKSLIAIVPPAQTRIVSGSIARVAITQVDTLVAQTAVSGGNFSTFMVNKQQPTSTDPVQVTFYMPKGSKAGVSVTSAEAAPTSCQVTASPQRVEVIQYKGQQLEGQGRNTTTILPSALVAPVSNLHTTSNRLVESTLSRPVSVSSVIQRTSASPTQFRDACSIGAQTSDILSVPPNTCKSIPNIRAVEPIESNAPVVVPNASNIEPIAPLQGLSEEQLLSLEQVLRGSMTGTVAQEKTIEYIEMLQKQLNTLLVQQQEILKSQKEGMIVASSNTIAISDRAADGIVESTASYSMSTSYSTTMSSSDNTTAEQSTRFTTSPDISMQNMILQQPIGSVAFQQLDASSKGTFSASQSSAFQTAHAVQPQQIASRNAARQLKSTVVDMRGSAMHPEAEMQLTGQTQSTISLTSTSSKKPRRGQQQQETETSSQVLQPISTQIFIPRTVSTVSIGKTDSVRLPISETSFSAQANSISMQNVLQPVQTISRPIQQQQQPILQFPYGTTSLQQPASQPFIQTAHLATQQPVLIGVQSSPQLSGASAITLPIGQAMSSSQITTLRSSSFPVLHDPNLITIAISGQGTSQTSGARPTMVDLAIAASQRTYLTDKAPTRDDNPLAHAQNLISTDDSSTSVVNCMVQSIPTVVISDSTLSKGSDTPGGKRSRLRFEDREVYKEYRRKNHVTAEQKRRGLIKIAFDQLISLIPSLQDDKQGRTSKALVLQKAVDYIDHLKREEELTRYKIEKRRREVNRLNEEIKICQQKLPACGAISEEDNPRDAKTCYLEHVRERIVNDHKYWLFSVMLRPLFESFCKNTVTQTLAEFINSVGKWFDEHCSLPVLRPAVIATLRQISTDTSILTDPSALPHQALQAAGTMDPTILGPQPASRDQPASTQAQMTSEIQTTGDASSGNQSAVFVQRQPVQWSIQPQQ